MYQHRREIVRKPTLQLRVSVQVNGALMLTCEVPEHLQCKIGCALRNSMQKKYFREGKLEILLNCMRNSSPTEKAEKLKAFCERFSLRSGITITAPI